EAERLRPEVVLLDIRLPGVDGFAVAERLASSAHPPAVVLISSRDARSYGPRLARAAARGFISKADLSGEALSGLVSWASCAGVSCSWGPSAAASACLPSSLRTDWETWGIGFPT